MTKHRTRISTRDDWNQPWAVPMWRNPNVKTRVVKCAVCHGMEREQRERRRNQRRRMLALDTREHLQLKDE